MPRAALILATAMFMALPAFAQQELTLQRDGDTLTLTLPDGAVETIVVEGDQDIRIAVRDGEVTVTRRTMPPGMRAFAFVPPNSERTGDVEIELETVFERLPEIFRERIEEVRLPRVRIERDVPSELRRDLAEAEGETRRVALELRRAEREGRETEAERLRGELTRALDRAFTLHQETRTARLGAIRERQEKLAAEGDELRAEIEERERRRAEIIERRRQELTRERDSLDW